MKKPLARGTVRLSKRRGSSVGMRDSEPKKPLSSKILAAKNAIATRIA
ncbi:MAG: hypothetical protein JHC73_19375 [Dolichospermum sp.]|nr:hypothetical protein [Dolichospermum sp.]